MKTPPDSTDSQTEGWFNLIRELPALPPSAELPSLASIILYHRAIPTEEHWPVRIGGLTLWVRGSVIQGENITTAATMALPREGEVVLAIIPYPDSEEAVWGYPLDAEDDLDEHKDERVRCHLRVVEASTLVGLQPFVFDVLLPGYHAFMQLNGAFVTNLDLDVDLNVLRVLAHDGAAVPITRTYGPHTKVVLRRRLEGQKGPTWGRFPNLYRAATQAYTVPEGFWVSYLPPKDTIGIVTQVTATLSPDGLDKQTTAC